MCANDAVRKDMCKRVSTGVGEKTRANSTIGQRKEELKFKSAQTSPESRTRARRNQDESNLRMGHKEGLEQLVNDEADPKKFEL